MSDNSIALMAYCLIGKSEDQKTSFLLRNYADKWAFPHIPMEKNEELYESLKKILFDELKILREGQFYIEDELDLISNRPTRDPLANYFYLYPIILSFDQEGIKQIDKISTDSYYEWMDLQKIIDSAAIDPKTRQIAVKLVELTKNGSKIFEFNKPSMEALASRWAYEQKGGVRLVRGKVIKEILDTGDRSFNLRVADPYLPYQKQGLGFTWSFFTYKDKQDVHVHGLPAVEIYGILEGTLMLWYKPMSQRGANTWRTVILEAGDWVEVEPLHCHFACWIEEKGRGVVVKAAGAGELAGRGKIGEKGKTMCKECNVKEQCFKHPGMIELEKEYNKEYEKGTSKRDWAKIKERVDECR
jgi:hypothetical protein